MLMYFILSIFYKLVIHQLSLTIVVINKHQINRGWSKVVSIFIFSVFLYVELVLTAFGKCPALAGLQFVGYFLNTFHVSGWRFRILMRTTDFLYFIPICMQVAFHKTDCHFGRIFMQFVFCLIFRNHRIFAA